jgi:predicted GH43/DUF377 family glycosyl hydrolase
MKWKKLGRKYSCLPIDDYLISLASNPLAIQLRDGIFRIFFSGRNIENKSSVGYFDYDIVRMKVISICDKSIFTFSDSNSFYSHGVSIGSLYEVKNIKYILFMGWKINKGEHWKGHIGRLKLSKNLNHSELDPPSVFIGIYNEDPISLSHPWVIKDDNIYKMWYGSTICWTSENGEMIHVIKYATSPDGISWQKQGLANPYEIGKVQVFSRPTVIKYKNKYLMWYSYRSGNGTPYRIGYAESLDKINWVRKNEEVGIDVSSSGRDSEMICYSYVFEYNGNLYMLYNGNGYGKTGIGLAILEQD